MARVIALVSLLLIAAMPLPTNHSEAGQTEAAAKRHHQSPGVISTMGDQSSPKDTTKAVENYTYNYYYPTAKSKSLPIWFQEVATGALVIFTFGLWLTSIWQWCAVKEQGEIAAKAQRAYLSITPDGVDDLRESGTPTITLIIRNEGNTPAYEVRFWSCIAIVTGDPFPNPTEFPEANFGPTFVLTPHAEFFTAPKLTKWLSRVDFQEIRTGDRVRLYVWGRVEYCDVFKKPHFLAFRRFLHVDRDGVTTSLYPTEEGNNAD